MTNRPQSVGAVGLEVPLQWGRFDTTVFVKPAQYGGFHANITVTARPRTTSDVKTAADQARQALLDQRLPGLRILGQTETQLAGRPAIRIDFRHSTPAAPNEQERLVDLQRSLVVLLVGNSLYELTTAAHEASEGDCAELEGLLKTLVVD